MDIRHLLYFSEVARLKSFTKASQTLHITQPSISKTIRLLEEDLGVTLLDRSGRQVELTDAGKAVWKQSQSIITSFQNLNSALADVMNLQKGNLVIGLPPMVGKSFFPRAIGQFSRIYPDINIQLLEVGSKRVESGVEDGSLELGVVMLPVKENTFEFFSFVEDPLMLLVDPDNPLAAKPVVDFADLANQSFVQYREDFALHDRIWERCVQSGFEPRIICESSQWDFMVEMVSAKLGIALLPKRICRELDPKLVITIPLAEPTILWHLAIIWKRNKYLSFAAREWLKFTADLFGVALPPLPK